MLYTIWHLYPIMFTILMEKQYRQVWHICLLFTIGLEPLSRNLHPIFWLMASQLLHLYYVAGVLMNTWKICYWIFYSLFISNWVKRTKTRKKWEILWNDQVKLTESFLLISFNHNLVFPLLIYCWWMKRGKFTHLLTKVCFPLLC